MALLNRDTVTRGLWLDGHRVMILVVGLGEHDKTCPLGTLFVQEKFVFTCLMLLLRFGNSRKSLRIDLPLQDCILRWDIALRANECCYTLITTDC
jgi:hypothetical protein